MKIERELVGKTAFQCHMSTHVDQARFCDSKSNLLTCSFDKEEMDNTSLQSPEKDPLPAWDEINEVTSSCEKMSNFRCHHCDKAYNSKKKLRLHIYKHIEYKDFKCPHCSKAYQHEHLLKQHLLLHTGLKEFKCDVCSKEFHVKSILNRHMKIHGVLSFKCHLCNKAFYLRTALKRHMIVHSDSSEKFKCALCEKEYMRKDSLKLHMLTHTNQKEFKCHICNTEFYNESNLTRHVIVHDDPKIFKCYQCLKEFKSKEFLKKHQLIHNGQQVIKCKLCRMKVERAFLERHMKINHGRTKEFKCDICGEEFVGRAAFQCHMSTHADQARFCENKINLVTCSFDEEETEMSYMISVESPEKDPLSIGDEINEENSSFVKTPLLTKTESTVSALSVTEIEKKIILNVFQSTCPVVEEKSLKNETHHSIEDDDKVDLDIVKDNEKADHSVCSDADRLEMINSEIASPGLTSFVMPEGQQMMQPYALVQFYYLMAPK